MPSSFGLLPAAPPLLRTSALAPNAPIPAPIAAQLPSREETARELAQIVADIERTRTELQELEQLRIEESILSPFSPTLRDVDTRLGRLRALMPRGM